MHTNIDPDLALELTLEHCPLLESETIPLAGAAGRILAESVASDGDHPPFDRATMDGFAVKIEDAGATVAVDGESAAGAEAGGELRPGCAVEIMTGAPCPSGAGLVIPYEDARREGDRVTLPENLGAGANIVRRGHECAAGAAVLEAGQRLNPLAMAALAALGRDPVCVVRQPRVAVVITGDEIGEGSGGAKIRDSNGPMLAAMLESRGWSAPQLLRAGDSIESLTMAFEAAAGADLVIVTGGVSMGKYDLVPKAMEQFGAEPVFHKITQKPGKPFYFATGGGRVFFCLPGNPLAAHLGFHRYIDPAIRKMRGEPHVFRIIDGVMTEDFSFPETRTRFQLIRAAWNPAGWRVTPVRGVGSADIFTAPGANAIARFEPGRQPYREGDPVVFEWLK